MSAKVQDAQHNDGIADAVSENVVAVHQIRPAATANVYNAIKSEYVNLSVFTSTSRSNTKSIQKYGLVGGFISSSSSYIAFPLTSDCSTPLASTYQKRRAPFLTYAKSCRRRHTRDMTRISPSQYLALRRRSSSF